jgi:SAM-dependent methyltransferase
VTATTNVDWPAWVERWDRQQAASLIGREERFHLMLDLVERQRGSGALRLLDLCCGCGSISARALRRFPAATVLAVDLDPLLLEMGRRTIGAAGAVEWREADLRRAEWAADLTPGSFDAILTATALHWFQADALVRLFGTLAPLLAEGGLFLNADHLPVGAPGLDALVKGLNDDWRAGNVAAGAETWDAYWAALAAEPELADLLAERERRFADRVRGTTPTVGFHREALLAAGFREVAEVWRWRNDAVLAAVR